MKKNFFFAAVAFAMISVSFTSCKKKNECIECNGIINVCKSQYEADLDENSLPWSSYKANATLIPGCKVVDAE